MIKFPAIRTVEDLEAFEQSFAVSFDLMELRGAIFHISDAYRSRVAYGDGDEIYQLRCAITGGEDAPDYVMSLPLQAILDVQEQNLRAHREDIDRAEQYLPHKEALSDLRSLRQEHSDLNGGGPGWAERNKAAWDRVDGLFADEDEAAYERQQRGEWG
jgi:hypothetical protein